MEVTVMQIFFGSCHQYSLVKASGALYYLQGLEEMLKMDLCMHQQWLVLLECSSFHENLAAMLQ